MGRPKYEITPEIIAKVETLASQGLTKEQIARCLGISYDTLNERQKDNVQFSEAIRNGQAKGLAVVTNALMENAKKGNVAAQIFYLKNRDREIWKDGADLNVSHSRKHGSVSDTAESIRDMLRDETPGQPEAPVTH